MAPPNIPETSADRLSRALPEALRPFVRIDSAVLPSAMLEIVAASVAEAGRRMAAVHVQIGPVTWYLESDPSI